MSEKYTLDLEEADFGNRYTLFPKLLWEMGKGECWHEIEDGESIQVSLEISRSDEVVEFEVA